MTKPVLALSGGIGGAKLALGLDRLLDPGQLTVVANTADDFVHLGLAVSPTIAGLALGAFLAGLGYSDKDIEAMASRGVVKLSD